MALFIFRHFVQRRVAHIGNPVLHLMTAVEVDLERQDGQHVADAPADVLHAPFLPSPHLGRDVIHHAGFGQMARNILGHAEVEARIIDQNQHIGPPRLHVAPALPHALQDGADMSDDRHKAHVGQRAVMAKHGAALGLHQVAPDKSELGLGVALAQGFHQVRGVEVTAGLTGYQVVFHGTAFF